MHPRHAHAFESEDRGRLAMGTLSNRATLPGLFKHIHILRKHRAWAGQAATLVNVVVMVPIESPWNLVIN